MSDFLFKSATEIADAVSTGKTTARAVTESALARIAATNPAVNAFTDVTETRARAEADAVDARIEAADGLPLAGVPFAVKNLFDLAGVVTRAGSKINRDNAPASADSILVKRLVDAGAVCVGALNMGEYAYDFTGRNAHDGNCNNPHDLSAMTGGSSSGSGAAVAAGMVPLALGSDTNGSIRVPSSFCGLFGLKPTFGRLSRAGSFPFTASLDHLGPFARSVKDLAIAHDVMQGPDPADPHLQPRPFEASVAHLSDTTTGLKIAIAGGYFRHQGFPIADAAVDAVAKALDVTREVEIPEAARARAAAFLITNAESAALHFPRLQTRAGDFDPETRDRFLAGTMMPAGWYIAAQRFRAWYRAAMNRLFQEVDVILAPATPFPALKSDQQFMDLNGRQVSARANIGIYTQPISFAGLPVVAAPLWLKGQTMPIAVQIIAAPWREHVALAVAARLEAMGVASAPIARL